MNLVDEMVHDAEDELNENQLSIVRGWKVFVVGFKINDILRLCSRVSDIKDDKFSRYKVLGDLSLTLLRRINELVKETGDNILDIVGNTKQEDPDNQQSYYRAITTSSLKNYRYDLQDMVYNMLLSLHDNDRSNSSIPHYPEFDPNHQKLLTQLDRALGKTPQDLESLQLSFDRVVNTLLLDSRHENRSPYHTDGKRRVSYYSPVHHWVIYRSFSPSGRFIPASQITQTFAHLLYVTRGLVMLRMQTEGNIDSVEQCIKMLGIYGHYIKKHSDTVMGRLLDDYGKLSYARRSEMAPQRFQHDSSDNSRIKFEGHPISLAKIKDMIEHSTTMFWKDVNKFLFFDCDVGDLFDVSKFRSENMFDDLNNTAVGYSFMMDHRNGLQDSKHQYGSWLLSDEQRQLDFISGFTDRGVPLWRGGKVMELLRTIDRLQTHLAGLVTLSCGPQARTTEICRMAAVNGSTFSRNLAIVCGTLALVSTNDKTSRQFNKSLWIPHVPPRPVANVLIFWLKFIRPWQQQMVALFHAEGQFHFTTRLFPTLNDGLTPDALTSKIKAMTLDYLGVAMSLRTWRAVVGKFFELFPDHVKNRLSTNFYFDLASMHTTATAIKVYGRDKADIAITDKRSVVGVVEAHLEWHKHTGLGQDDPYVISGFHSAKEKSDTKEDGKSAASIDVEALSKDIVHRTLPELATLVKDTVNDTISQCMAVQFPEPVAMDSELGSSTPSLACHPSRLYDLRTFLGDPSASFQSPEQAQFVEELALGQRNILAIMGTGSGKSTMLMFYCKRYASRRTTVVILPISGLHEELESKATKFGVTFSRWVPRTSTETSQFNRGVSLVYVSIEHLGHKDFQRFLCDACEDGVLASIWFDEIHKIVTESDYRAAMQNVRYLVKLKCVKIGLSASLPPHLFNYFSALTEISWTTIRTSSARPELKLRYRSYPTNREVMHQAITHAKEQLHYYCKDSRMVVFCRTKADAKDVATALGTVEVTSDHDQQHNGKVVENWRKGKPKVLVGTSIIGVGIDYPAVRDVIHVGLSYDVVSQYQQESRGGRDGRRCNAITFFSNTHQPSTKELSVCLGSLYLFKMARDVTQCRRVISTIVLDGKAKDCMSLQKAELCDVCERLAIGNVTNVRRMVSQTAQLVLPVPSAAAYPGGDHQALSLGANSYESISTGYSRNNRIVGAPRQGRHEESRTTKRGREGDVPLANKKLKLEIDDTNDLSNAVTPENDVLQVEQVTMQVQGHMHTEAITQIKRVDKGKQCAIPAPGSDDDMYCDSVQSVDPPDGTPDMEWEDIELLQSPDPIPVREYIRERAGNGQVVFRNVSSSIQTLDSDGLNPLDDDDMYVNTVVSSKSAASKRALDSTSQPATQKTVSFSNVVNYNVGSNWSTAESTQKRYHFSNSVASKTVSVSAASKPQSGRPGSSKTAPAPPAKSSISAQSA
ncbi:hypothetical protein CVT24_012794, partial [Panaeolus cyanescens]